MSAMSHCQLIRLILFISFAFTACNCDKTVGFPDWISQEYWNEECQTEGVPKWLEGTLVRHQCGAFGNAKGSRKRSISHFYDCLGMLNAFKFDNGRVTFSSRYFDSEGYRLWAPRSRTSTNNEPTRVAWRTLFSPIDDQPTSRRSGATLTGPSASPSGDIWPANDPSCTLEAYSDAADGYKVRLRNGKLEELRLEEKPSDNSDFPSDSIVLHHSAQAKADPDGNLWGAVLLAKKKSEKIYDIERAIYKVENVTGRRTAINDILTSTVKLANCYETGKDQWSYFTTKDSEQFGYVNNVAATGSYVVLIENPFVFNPCALMEKAQSTPKPFLATWFKWAGTQLPTKFHVIDKQSQQLRITAEAPAPSAFISRTINVVEKAPEDGGYIVIDAVTHPDEKFLTQYLNVDYLSSVSWNWPTDAVIRRYVIDVNSGAVVQYNHTKLLPSASPTVISSEFATINEANHGRSYSYTYLLVQPFSGQSALWKVDLRYRSPIQSWIPERGAYPAGEPVFVQRTGGNEDNGVLLVPAFNSNSKKGLIFLLDASSMTQIGRVTAPDLITFGTYTRFLPTCAANTIYCWTSLLVGLACVLLIFQWSRHG